MAKQISRISNNTNKSSFILVTKQSKTSTNCDNLTTNRHRCLLFLSLPTTSMLTHNFSFPHWSPLFLHSITFEEWQHEWWVCQCMGWETHPSCYHSMTTLESSRWNWKTKERGIGEEKGEEMGWIISERWLVAIGEIEREVAL